MDNIHFLGEEDFLSAMNNENKTWRENYVTSGSFTSFDGTKLNYYIAAPVGITRRNKECTEVQESTSVPDVTGRNRECPEVQESTSIPNITIHNGESSEVHGHTSSLEPRISITIVHGFGEFFAKYHEYAWYFSQAGCQVFFLEQRGYGYSEGKLSEPDLVYIDDYSTYVEDLYAFTNQVVIPKSKSIPRLVLAHSMGGAVTTRFLELHPDVFDAAILSSPMLKMRAGNINRFVETILRIYVALYRLNKKLAFNQKRFNPNPVFETSSAKSRARFEYQLQCRIDDPHYQTTGATFGWALASLKVHRDIFKDINKINCPIDLFTAGQDHLIDPAGYEMFIAKVKNVVIHPFEQSRHEIFNSDDNDRHSYFSKILEIIDSY